MSNIIRNDPLQDLARAFDPPHEFESAFGWPKLRHWLAELPSEPAIKLDVSEDEKAYHVKAELPGVKKEDIAVDIDGNQVSLTAESRRETEQKKGETVVHSERFYGKPFRTFTLRQDIDRKAAIAKFADGVLELLPTAEVQVSGPWHSFDEARAAIERIEPHRTTTADLRASGIDPYEGPNVQLLSYSDILLRFPMGVNFANGPVDRGLHECLGAGKSCTGYSISVREMKHDRTGSFWLDALGFKRVSIPPAGNSTRSSSWWAIASCIRSTADSPRFASTK